MVYVDTGNPPVSVQLAEGETVTVPSGEIWKVNVTLGVPNNETATITFEGYTVLSGSGVDLLETTIHATGGGSDFIGCTGANSAGANLHIGGWVTNG